MYLQGWTSDVCICKFPPELRKFPSQPWFLCFFPLKNHPSVKFQLNLCLNHWWTPTRASTPECNITNPNNARFFFGNTHQKLPQNISIVSSQLQKCFPLTSETIFVLKPTRSHPIPSDRVFCELTTSHPKLRARYPTRARHGSRKLLTTAMGPGGRSFRLDKGGQGKVGCKLELWHPIECHGKWWILMNWIHEWLMFF